MFVIDKYYYIFAFIFWPVITQLNKFQCNITHPSITTWHPSCKLLSFCSCAWLLDCSLTTRHLNGCFCHFHEHLYLFKKG